MIKKRQTRAADRSFGLIGAVLMRCAIRRLIRIDDHSLSDAGLSRAAVTDFLESPLRTDPHRFFSRHKAHRHQQQAGDAKPRPASILHVIRQMASFRMQVLTTGVLVAVCALSACSGGEPDRDPTEARRDRPARCRLPPDPVPFLPIATSNEHHAGTRALPEQSRDGQPEARAGPF